MATYPRVPTQNNSQYTLDTQLSAGGTSLTLNQSVSSIVQAPGYGWIDRVDSSGSVTPTKREYFYFTGVSSAQLTGLTRGLAGSTDQVHSVGAIVEFGPNVSEEADKYSVFTTEHTVTGVHASLPSLSFVLTQNLVGVSGASLNSLNMKTLFSASGASVVGLTFPSQASGHILQLRTTDGDPVWGPPTANSAVASLTTTAKARASRGSNQSISDVTITKVALDTEQYDPGSNFDAVTNNRFVAPVTGYYVVTGQVTMQTTGSGKRVIAYIYKNGSAYAEAPTSTGVSTNNGSNISDIIPLNATDYLELFVYQDSGGAINVKGTAAETYMAAHLISA